MSSPPADLGLMDDATPYFVLQVEELERRATDFAGAFAGAQLYYALKANSVSAVLLTLARSGCGFEAASWQEIELLTGLGIGPESIIYGTAVKPPSHVARAVAIGISRFAADSAEEIDLLGRLAPGSRVFVRALVDDSHSVFQMSGKFGAPIGAVPALLRRVRDRDLVPWGVSFNVGSQATRVDAWARGVEAVRPIFEDVFREGIELPIMNIGGGFPAKYRNHPAVPDLKKIGTTVREALLGLPYQPQLIIEPGRGLVATSMSLVTTIVARIERNDGTWLFLDAGVYNALFEAMVSQGQTRYPVSALSVTGDDTTRSFVLAGPTGDGIDIVDPGVHLPARLAVGDRLRFDNVGAYTLAMASSFNGFPKPPLHVTGNCHGTGG